MGAQAATRGGCRLQDDEDRTIATLDFAEGIQPQVTRAPECPARFDADGDVN